MIYLNINICSASALFFFFFFNFYFPSRRRAARFVCVSATSRAAVGIVLCARGERVRARAAFHVRARSTRQWRQDKKKNKKPQSPLLRRQWKPITDTDVFDSRGGESGGRGGKLYFRKKLKAPQHPRFVPGISTFFVTSWRDLVSHYFTIPVFDSATQIKHLLAR